MRKINLNILIAVCVLTMTLTWPVGADTHYVTPGQSIQAAIDAAVNGDEIEVAQGTYNEAINFNGKAVRLYSSSGSAVTTIDANGIAGAYHVVQCVSGEDANTILEGFTITGGNANGLLPSGGGMYDVNSSPTVTNCAFIGNSADYGGGMSNENSNPTVTNCTFSGNTANGDGGGMDNYSSSNPTVTNCTFSGNIANRYGGGMDNWESSNPTVTNCTFSGNSATNAGGMFNYASSSTTVTNCIFWGDTPDEVNDVNSSSTVTYSDVDGGTGQSWFGTGCIDADPLFINATGGDLRLSSSASPCVDTGNNSAPSLPATDLAGNPRVVDGDRNGTAVVDMGAFELQSREIRNITQDRWYETIQVAIDDANNGDEIEVAPGTYNEAINFNGKAVRLYSSHGPDVTTIDANGTYHVVQCVSGEDANTILEGFTITGGNANGSSPDDRGGGMYNDNSIPTITSCIFTGNKATFGGGMLNIDCNPTVTGCTFENNTASGAIGGGGMYNHNSSPLLTYCTFSGNSGGPWGGGGIFNAASSNPTLINCTFSGNVASYGGGGIYNWNDTTPILINCTFSGNSANYGGGMFNINNSRPTVTGCSFNANMSELGGGMFDSNSSSTVTNCTFSSNIADANGGGMYNTNTSSPTVTNCILWGNEPNEILDVNSSTTVTYSDVDGGTGQSWFGTGCIDADPCFIDPNGPDGIIGTKDDNLRLKSDSPCIDAGDNSAVTEATDLDGLERIVDANCDGTATVDMGAYEFDWLYLGDFAGGCDIDFVDFSVLAQSWLQDNPAIDIAPYLDPDGIIDFQELIVMTDNWLADL